MQISSVENCLEKPSKWEREGTRYSFPGSRFQSDEATAKKARFLAVDFLASFRGSTLKGSSRCLRYHKVFVFFNFVFFSWFCVICKSYCPHPPILFVEKAQEQYTGQGQGCHILSLPRGEDFGSGKSKALPSLFLPLLPSNLRRWNSTDGKCPCQQGERLALSYDGCRGRSVPI